MEIPDKFKKEPSELKLFPERGSVRVYFEDGTFWEVEEPEKQVITPEKNQSLLPDKFLGYLSEPMVNRLLYLLMMRPYNKLNLGISYYNRKKNIARGHIDRAISKLKKMNLISKVDWAPELMDKYGITSRSKHIFCARTEPLISLLFSDETHIHPEYFFLVNTFKVNLGHISSKFFFEWNTDRIKDENVDVLKLMKLKIYELMIIASCVKNKHNEIWYAHTKAISANFLEIMKKLGVLFQHIDPQPVLDYLVTVLMDSVAEPVVEDLKSMLEAIYSTTDSGIFNIAIFIMFLPPMFLDELLKKIALF